MTVYTMDELAEASGLSTARLQKIDDDELKALAESVLLEDDAPDGSGGGPAEDLETLSDEELRMLAAVLADAGELGVDLPAPFDQIADDGTAAAAATALAADGGSSSGSNGVSLTANTRKVAEAHGLPTDWAALDGIPAPPSLADLPMSDDGLAAWINRAHGVDGPDDRVVTPSLVATVRDKGVERDSIGPQVEDLAANDAGLDNNLEEENPLPVQTVRNRVEAHVSRTRQSSAGDGYSSGVSLEDVAGE